MSSLSKFRELFRGLDSPEFAEAFVELARFRARCEIIRARIGRDLTRSEVYWLMRGWVPASISSEVSSDE